MIGFENNETAPGSAGNAAEGLAQRTTNRESIAMDCPQPTAPLDGCPSCVRRGNRAVYVTADDDGLGVTALYRCSSCLMSWRTSWATGNGWGAA